MPKTIEQRVFPQQMPRQKRVAAYARVSSAKDAMLSILASFAQAESQSVSENQKWRVKKNFQEGKPWDGTLLGYRYYDGRYVIEPTEAETVRRIYREYLSGKGTTAIANGLNADGVPTRLDRPLQGRKLDG